MWRRFNPNRKVKTGFKDSGRILAIRPTLVWQLQQKQIVTGSVGLPADTDSRNIPPKHFQEGPLPLLLQGSQPANSHRFRFPHSVWRRDRVRTGNNKSFTSQNSYRENGLPTAQLLQCCREPGVRYPNIPVAKEEVDPFAIALSAAN